ncbi:hypothetical protein FVQ98_04185 [Ottowia sp. GY511]|uniref:Uncharacterized protein n=1 Tax=Ottowia flava TaxID=2675430 RepID=A0ABW4KYE2_9BURK|nr:hypothetical protein [Ottowia sp. GY511]TXK31188.1 hypothetical protein FVQ98_04185 [Ottowia sp. GY511]
MIYQKTELGQRAMKDRHAVEITRAQRSALILLDGQRSTASVLDATLSLGVSREDIDRLAELGLIATMPGSASADMPRGDAQLTDFASSTLAARHGPMDLPVAPNNEEERVRRYKKAYPLATQITATLGLRGFKLNLAVESAQGFDGLIELLPKIRAAVGDERVQPLRDALEGR